MWWITGDATEVGMATLTLQTAIISIIQLEAVNYRTELFTHLKLCSQHYVVENYFYLFNLIQKSQMLMMKHTFYLH